jgi:2-deoxy-D-gluconate 3-dehydrogenase
VREMEGKVVLITGAAQGIGEAIALRMAQAGARVALSDILEQEVHATAHKIANSLQVSYGRDVISTKVDVADSKSVAAWVQATAENWGRIDVLINNAGIQLNSASVDITDEQWHKVLGVDLDGVFFCCREAAKVMLSQKQGVMINIASVAAQFGMPRRLPYGVAKAGVCALTRVLAAEWAEQGIRVNAIGPGYIETEINRYAFEQGHIKREEIEAKIPLKSMADPKQIAETALFLSSDKAAYITGQTIYVDGGYTITK